jgi:hypothetical protein
MKSVPQIFLSHADEDTFEASLLQACLEITLGDLNVRVWSYKRDQPGDERTIARSLPDRVRESSAAIFLISQFTLKSGATQWMELAYADAFGIPIFVLLHHLSFETLRRAERNVPPLLIEGQCTLAGDWRSLESALRRCCGTDDDCPDTSSS